MSIFNKIGNNYSSQISKCGGKWGVHDYFIWHKIRYLENNFLNNMPSDSVILDYGTGSGSYIEALDSHKHIMIGVEPCLDMIKYRKVAVFDGNQLPFKDKCFDFIYSICVFHHILPDKRKASINEIKRVLKPDGTFLLIEHNLLNPITRSLVARLEMDKDAMFLSPKESLVLLSKYFSRISRSYILFFPEFLKSLVYFEKYLSGLPLGGQYSIVCRG